jgi:hypothetical protein
VEVLKGEIIFLDMDGVLNDFLLFDPTRSPWVLPHLADNFNRLLAALPDAMIVLSSSWRYMIHGGAMTHLGFEHLLRTHRILCQGRVEGVTAPDEQYPTRGEQIRRYVNDKGGYRPHVVLDDHDDAITAHGLHLVRTRSDVGLTSSDVDAAIRLILAQRSKLMEALAS